MHFGVGLEAIIKSFLNPHQILQHSQNTEGEKGERMSGGLCVDMVEGGLALLCWGIGKRMRECKMYRGIGVVNLDLIREVCFVLCLTGTHCCTASLRRPA